MGSAPRWRLEQGLRVFSKALEHIGSRLILRRGQPDQVLTELIRETGAGRVFWSHGYDRKNSLADIDVANSVKAAGAAARHGGEARRENDCGG